MGNCVRTAEAPDLPPGARLAEPEPAVATAPVVAVVPLLAPHRPPTKSKTIR